MENVKIFFEGFCVLASFSSLLVAQSYTDADGKEGAKIDAEIVAEFVQKRLLTNEADIRSLVQAEPGVAQRFWDKIKNWGKRMFGSADSRTVARLEHMEGLYRKAFAESNKGGFTPGNVAVQEGSVAQAQTDSVTEQRRQTEEAYARGELTDEDYDAAMDEFDRAEEERLGRSLEKYSFENSNSKIPQKWLRQAYSRKPISLSKKDWSKVNDARAEKYRGLEENQIPEVDFFPLAEYNELNIGHMYVIRNYGIDTFAVISKKRLTGRYDGYLMEAANDGRTVQKVDEGAHREGVEQRGQYLGNQMPRNGGALSGDAERSGEYGNAEQGNSSADGGLDSGSDLSPNNEPQFSFSGSSIFSNGDSAGNQLSAEQQEYFKDSEARDDGGNLLVLYHQTDGNFTIFDTRYPGAGSRDNGTPFGIFMKRSAGDIGLAGKKQMALYANITNPLRATNREDLTRKLCEISERYASISDQHKKLDAEYREKFEQAKKEWVKYITEWRSANPGESRNALNADPKFNELYDAEDNVVDEWTAAADRLSAQAKEAITEDLRKAGYDGVFLAEDVGSWGRKTDAIIALDPEQVKSITNKKPTSDPDIRYSLSSPKVKEQGRPLEGWYDSDEKQLQAQKAGYPVLKGEQVVPYATWVRSEERGNYGLVTGKTDDGRLLVSFHNKHDGSMARDVAIHPDMLTPVEGAYQMTKEEFASLMESEPLEVSEQAYTAEEVRELEELFRRSGGKENGTAQPIDMDKLPRKAQKFLNRAKRRMLSSVRKALGVSKFSDNQQIQEAVESR